MKGKDLPNNLEDAIMLSFIWAEWFFFQVLQVIHDNLIRIEWYFYNRKIRIADKKHQERLRLENESNQKV